MTVENTIVAHYRHGALEEALLQGLAAAGKDVDNLTPDDLAAADEFHIGGRQATIDFVAEFKPDAGMHWLDIGSGLGGPSRYVAHSCHRGRSERGIYCRRRLAGAPRRSRR